MKSFNSIKTLCVTSLLALAMASEAVAETTLRYAEATPNRGSRAEALQFFADEIKERSEGELVLDIHWGGALLKYSGILGGVSAGTADMGSVLAAYEPTKMRGLSIGDIPVEGNSDPWVAMRAMYELMTTNEQIRESFADEGVVYVGNYTTTPVQLECTEGNAIHTLADLKGKRIRASVIYAKIVDELGANLVNFTYEEVYQALDSGLVDCSAGYLYAMRSFKTPEVTSSVTLTNWGQITGFAMMMNKFSWDDLNEEQQQLMLQTGSDMVDFYAETVIEESQAIIDALPTGELGNEIEVIKMADSEREKLLALSDKYIDMWIEEMNQAGFDGQSIWDEYQQLLAKYQQVVDEKGYPWEG
ncbi:C4-dicarboxylate TRAP transporter substrate-binding protein [Marinobacter caseinilyticus]|uniref:C4-dicarboxylate TRAP transporter substrate-binding protein n=1 Tax=Marinobacter caseinilyticus TaxID=2692195 RepID=UPI00140AD238|nr:C4-dicarboxylate TRAP transporter substrate-binding protein [Marinobacter caseinilyticus]